MYILYLSVSGYPPGNGDKMNISCYERSETIDDCDVFSSPDCSDNEVMALSCVGMYAYEHMYISHNFSEAKCPS